MSNGFAFKFKVDKYDGLTFLQSEVARINEANGWRDNFDPLEPRDVKHEIAEISLVMMECGEAIDELRHGRLPHEVYYTGGVGEISEGERVDAEGNLRKPEGVPIELADALIYLLDFADKHNVDIVEAVKTKLKFQETRGYRHGGKVA